MLKKFLVSLFILFLLLQLWLVYHLQLFGDESFYWLEGQFLDWSYSELPGWTAWMIRLGTELFGNNYFAVRFFSFSAYLSLFWVIWLLNKKSDVSNIWILLSLPIVSLVATMALPDIWLLFFVLWSSYFVTKAIDSKKAKDWIVLGCLLACSINVHIRMWIWLFFAGIVFIAVFYSQRAILKSALFITLPITLLGLIPVLVFNIQHDFPLIDFQLSQRHPWQFQFSNINFLLSQLVVITPLVLFIWFKRVFSVSHDKITNWLTVTALLHWMFYVVMSFFVDGLRTNVHWLIISYVPVLVVMGNSKLKKWAIITGSMISFILFIFLSINDSQKSRLQARLLDNSMGWKALAKEVEQIQNKSKVEMIVSDYFMTASELAFESIEISKIKVLSHKKNIKHGREKQLQIMGLLLDNPKGFKTPAILVVEDSALKLQDKGRYYQNLCDDFTSIRFERSFPLKNTTKQYTIFRINGPKKICEFPPIYYIDHKIENNKIVISGWVVSNNVGIDSLAIISGDNILPIDDMQLKNTGIQSQFPEINDPNAPNNGFRLEVLQSEIADNKFRIRITDNNKSQHTSQLYFIN